MRHRRKLMNPIYKDDKHYRIQVLMNMINLNESQKRLGYITSNEYNETVRNITEQFEVLDEEVNPSFDEQMGHPMDMIDDMMEIFK